MNKNTTLRWDYIFALEHFIVAVVPYADWSDWVNADWNDWVNDISIY